MEKIHEYYYFSRDKTLQFIYQEDDGLFYIEDDKGDKIVLNQENIEDLKWFIGNKIIK